MLSIATALAACSSTALLLPQAPVAVTGAATRRGVLNAVGGAAAALAFASSASASDFEDIIDGNKEFNKMGGLLEPFVDTQHGFKLYKPAGWNKFESDPGVFDIKFQDIIEQETTVQVSTSPVATATSVDALGELDAVGTKFAKSRDAKLISATSRDADGSLVYTFELQGEVYHELLALCINRGKLYRVSTVTGNKKWGKRKELYANIVASFIPKGY